jgi:hypothetical protein
MKINLLLITISMLISTVLSGQTVFKGKVQDAKGEGIPFVNILIKQNGVFVKGVQADFDGAFNLPLLNSGVFDFEISSVGYKTLKISELSLIGEVNRIFKMEVDDTHFDCGLIYIIYRNPLIQTTPTAGQILYSEDFINRGSIR